MYIVKRDKGSVRLIISGSTEEIKWIKNALQNNCEDCPYGEECNQNAVAEKLEKGKISLSCKAFLEEKIKFNVK